MDNPAPWRVLESPDSPATATAIAASTSSAAAPAVTGRLAVIGGLLVAGAVVAVAIVLAVSGSGGSVDVGGGAVIGGPSAVPAAVGTIVVEVSGAVRTPGVYELPTGARVADAIEAAGGYGPRVDVARATAALDLAAKLTDGATVAVPSRDDPAPVASSGGGGGAGGSTGGLVNLNTASASELDTLPGVGPVTAQKIIDARAEKPFGSVDELRERGLLGEKTFEKLRDLVTVG